MSTKEPTPDTYPSNIPGVDLGVTPAVSPVDALENDSPKNDSAEWNEHEQITEALILEAQKFIELVGSPKLAKQAVNVAESRIQERTES